MVLETTVELGALDERAYLLIALLNLLAMIDDFWNVLSLLISVELLISVGALEVLGTLEILELLLVVGLELALVGFPEIGEVGPAFRFGIPKVARCLCTY